jgi:hypothetical protein
MSDQSGAMPDSIASAVKLLWLSLIISAGSFVWASVVFSLSSEAPLAIFLSSVVQFATFGGLWAFAIIHIPRRNNLARLILLVMTAYLVYLMLILVLKLIVLSYTFLFVAYVLLNVAQFAVAVLGCFLLVQKPGNDWFGPLTRVSL